MYERILARGKIGGVELKNRVVLSPMEEVLGQANGEITPRAVEYYVNKAKGGCGLVIVGYVAVTDEKLCGVAKPGQINLWNGSDRHAMSVLADRVHQYGSKVFVQLHHPGSRGFPKYNGGRPNVSSTALPSRFVGKMQPNHELTVDEIHQIEEDFANAAEHAYWAGCDGVELHVGHFYLLHQFLCPVRNERTDEYGGSMENRCRIVVEIIEKIRERTPDNFAITLRMHLVDNEGYPDNLSNEDMVEIAKYFESKGVDAFNFSIGISGRIGAPAVKTGWRSEYFKPFKKALHVPIYGNNETKSPDDAEKMMEEGLFDFVLLGRALTADPAWANKAKAGKPEDIRPCISCNYCVYCVNAENRHIRCAVNPLLGREIDNLMPLEKGEGTVVVIGAGPAGIQASLVLAERGFQVELYDKRSELCGNLNLANKAPGKFRMNTLIKYYTHQIEKNPNIELHLNTEITADKLDELAALDPYAVVLASGGKPIVPATIPGIEKGIPGFDVLTGAVKLSGKKVAVIGGGMTGLEVAERLAEDGNQVTVVEMKPVLGDGTFVANINYSKKFLEDRGAVLKTSMALKEIRDGSILIEPYHGKYVGAGLSALRSHGAFVEAASAEESGSEELEVDATVLSLGIKPDLSFREELEKHFANVVHIGDCTAPGRIGEATSSGYFTAKNL